MTGPISLFGTKRDVKLTNPWRSVKSHPESAGSIIEKYKYHRRDLSKAAPAIAGVPLSLEGGLRIRVEAAEPRALSSRPVRSSSGTNSSPPRSKLTPTSWATLLPDILGTRPESRCDR